MALRNVIALLALLVASSAVVSATVFGGTASVANLELQLVINYGARGAEIGGYKSVESEAGQIGFINKHYAIVASDEPLSIARDRQAGKKYTLPQVFSGYSFVVQGSDSVRLTARQIYLIYVGRIKSWSQVPGSGFEGAILPIARGEPGGSSTTEVITKWLQKNKAGIPTYEVGLGPWKTGNGNIRYYLGTNGVCTAVNLFGGSIGYAQTGIAVQVYGLQEVAVLNPARVYVKASTSDINQVLPRGLPPSAGVWSGVSLLNARGQRSYPIASFVYLFVRQHYGPKGAAIVKPFLSFLFSTTAQKTVPGFYFAPLPTKILVKNIAAIKRIT